MARTSPLGLCAIALSASVALGVLPACSTRDTHAASTEVNTNMKTVMIPVAGMSCAACTARIKTALASIDGVGEVEVNLAKRNARVKFAASKLSPDRLVAAINGLGYRAGTPAEAK